MSRRWRSKLPPGFIRHLRGAKHLALRPVYRLYPLRAEVYRPVFVLGCGRSGTTILGRTLSRHPRLAYLEEPRHIWMYEPRTNIWAEGARQRGAKLELTERDVSPEAAARIRRAFAVETERQRASRVVGKLPINSFRIPFLDAIFPDAIFIHLLRHGLEVAASIQKMADHDRWFGGEKWSILADHARDRGDARLVDLCDDNYLKGLLEWNLSVTAARNGLGRLDPARSLEVRYGDLLEDPVAMCRRLEDFIGVEPSPEMHACAAATIKRRSRPAAEIEMSPAARSIAGPLLEELGFLG